MEDIKRDDVDVVEEEAEEVAPVQETKHQRFYRITEKRVRNAAKYISLLSACASNDYEYTQEDAEKMFAHLQAVLDDTRAKYIKKEMPEFSW